MKRQAIVQVIAIFILLCPIGMYNVSGTQVVLVTGFEPLVIIQ